MSDHGEQKVTVTIYPVPKPQRRPTRLPKKPSRSKRSQKSGGHAFPKNVSLSRRAFIHKQRCIATGRRTGQWVTAQPWMSPALKSLCPYKARVVCAHIDNRGAGHPDEANMVPLEWELHTWQTQIGWTAFVKRLRLMPAKELAALYETRYRAANANYQKSDAGGTP